MALRGPTAPKSFRGSVRQPRLQLRQGSTSPSPVYILYIVYILVYFNLHGDDHCCKESTWCLSRCAPPSWWWASRRAAQRVTGWSSTWATRLRHRRGSWWTTGTWKGSVSRWELDLWHRFPLWKDVPLVAFKVDWLNSTHISLKQLHSKCLYVDHLPQVRRLLFLEKYFG